MSFQFPPAFPRLVSPRLVLDALRGDDRTALFAIHSDAEAMRYWSTPPWPDDSPAVGMLERDPQDFARGEVIRWAIRRPGDTRLVGTATLFRFSAQNLRAEIGYILGREHWGQGLMREAMDAILDYAFGPLGLQRIEADTDPRNAASIGMLERLGFVREGLLRRRWIVGGEVCDSVLLGLLRDERRRD
jgi:RimJ/RimL family protein N-acetyltransferase